MQSKFIASEFIERLYGARAAGAVTILVLWTALASVFALLFGYSRIPYAAAVNGHFFSAFARIHPTGRFPYVSLLVMGGLSIAASMFTLDAVISALLTSRILVQFLTQVYALHYMRKQRPEIRRPFRMWLYPIPSVIALVGWTYVFATSGARYIVFGILTLIAGAGAYWLWSSRSERRS
jgi:amino acid transporter